MSVSLLISFFLFAAGLGTKCTSPLGLILFITICRGELHDAFTWISVVLPIVFMCLLPSPTAPSELCWTRICGMTTPSCMRSRLSCWGSVRPPRPSSFWQIGTRAGQRISISTPDRYLLQTTGKLPPTLKLQRWEFNVSILSVSGCGSFKGPFRVLMVTAAGRIKPTSGHCRLNCHRTLGDDWRQTNGLALRLQAACCQPPSVRVTLILSVTALSYLPYAPLMKSNQSCCHLCSSTVR